MRNAHELAGTVSIHAQMNVGIAVAVIHTGGWGWETRCTTLTAWLVRLRQVYRGAKIDSNVDLWGIVNSFMVDCAHMQDVLGLDPSVSVTEAEAKQAVDASEPLTICRDYANTWKHYLRRKQEHQVAAIWEEGLLHG
jgi:hypothetical protein